MPEGLVAFTTRRGEVETGNAYSGFNITHYCGDKAESVWAHRNALAMHLGIKEDRIILPLQKHGHRLLTVEADFLHLALEERESRLEGVDALVTSQPGVCIGVSTADCLPILLYDDTRSVVAAVHAGWRGTVQHILSLTLERIFSDYAVSPQSLHAVFGPAISLEAFEVGNEVYEAFRLAGYDMAQIACRMPAATGEKWHLDLCAANYLELEQCGVPLRNIRISGICTYSRCDEFFSARRLGVKSGRLFSGIMMKS